MSANPSGSQKFQPVTSDINLPKMEEKILEFWKREKIFEKSLEANEWRNKFYSFYDGPPFATGLPHYGHMMAGTLKDIVPRYWTMKGHLIPRRFGWDCHGLPVEYEINKALKIETSQQVKEMGIAKYNAECRSIVKRYSTEWRQTVERMGRWVDMDHAYYTMDIEFMQSVWWVFQELYKKGLIYEGHKVVPYSTGVSTPLSNFEANLNYKQVQDPAVTVAFPIIGREDLSFLAWTTTPWTLPSNLALAVGKDLDYVTIRVVADGKKYVLAEALLGSYFKKPAVEVEILERKKGSDWLGTKYIPLFQYFQEKSQEGAFQVIWAEHVTTESGTGIVHMAPAFGEEDYYACKREKLPIVNPVDDDGCFTAEVPDFKGQRVKDADKEIIATLKKSGRLFKQDTLVHSYPYCWRSDTPLIYRAVSSWFVAVEKIKEQILAANQTTAWVPEVLRDGRFGKWLEGARDWAVTRNRFWGTPIPIWKNDEGEVICVGSHAELERLSGQKVADLHMEFLEKITIPSPTGKSPLKRVTDVLDCWFESGSMPYAQWGFPFKNKEEFEKYFPAEFIAEGLDQTRGWFYTLMVIGTGLFGKAPFKNVIVNGMILAEDGKKMSKSLRNYPDPGKVMGEHGADGLRLYLIDSPAVKAQDLKFSEKGVRDIVRKIFIRWWNAYSFFVSYANIDRFAPVGDCEKSPNILDQWILSRLHTLIATTEKEMAAYRLYNVVPALLQFIEELTNTYIRFNRSHFWQDGMPEDKRLAYETLYTVLTELTKIMAPFAPFISEEMYLNLSRALPKPEESVHLEQYPKHRPELRKEALEQAVGRMETLVVLGRNYREKIKVKAKIPLLEMKVIHREAKVLTELKKLESYFQDELNIRKITYLTDEDNWVQVSAKANFQALGARLGPKMKSVAGGIAQLTLADILKLESGASLDVAGETIGMADVEIRRAPKANAENLQTHQLITLAFDPTVTDDQIQEGLAREIIRKIQQGRKNAKFILDDRIRVELKLSSEFLTAATRHEALIRSETLATEYRVVADSPSGTHVEKADVDEGEIIMGLTVIRQ